MKHLKLFEEKSYHYMSDYVMPDGREKLLRDIRVLRENNIPFDLFHHVPTEDFLKNMLVFKIYYYGTLSMEDKKILKNLDMYYLSDNYEFTWPWIKTPEDEIQFLIDQQKYNL